MGGWRSAGLAGRLAVGGSLGLSGRSAPLALGCFVRGFGDTFADLRPCELNFCAQSFRDRVGLAFAARHAAHIRWIATQLLGHAIVHAPAKRGKTPQVRSMIIVVQPLRAAPSFPFSIFILDTSGHVPAAVLH